MSTVAALTVFSTFISLVHGQQCPYKECYCDDSDIDCSNLNLQSIPARMTYEPNLAYLDFKNNQFSIIPAGALPPNLTEVNFLNNPIITIDDWAFSDSAATLQSITFANVQFVRIPDAFLHLNALTSLNMFDSTIQDWNTEAMKHIGQTLQSLQLDNMNIFKWPSWIQFLPRLTEIRIVNNFISEVPDDALDSQVDNLINLYFYNNYITSVPKAFSKFKSLQMLLLDDNKLTDVAWLPQASKLYSLALGNNKLTDAHNISEALRPFAECLNDVDFEGNQLKKIPEISFLQGVTTLDFSNNALSDPSSGSLPFNLTSLDLSVNSLGFVPVLIKLLTHLVELNLDSNLIQTLRGEDLPRELLNIDLTYNRIIEIKDTSFPQNSSLQTLILDGNPLSVVSTNAFINIPNLTLFHVRYTKLTRLPLGIASLGHLKDFDITGTDNLVCTCMEKNLGYIIMAMLPQYVLGSCGKSTVYDFFTILSPSCP